MNRHGNVITRLESQLTMEQCLDGCGVALDAETAISITAFCWANDLNVAMTAFDMVSGLEMEEFED